MAVINQPEKKLAKRISVCNGPFHLKTLICSKGPSKHYVSTFSEKNTPTQSEHPEGKFDPISDPEGPTWLKIHSHFGLVSRFR